jgi:hypothetical protein
MSARDEFYVGYVDRTPSGLARFVRRVVIGMGLASAIAAVLLAGLQRPLPSGVFEFGVVRDFEGVLYERPLPLLRTDGPAGGSAAFLLAGSGKRGIPDVAQGHHGKRVRFRGSLVHRQGSALIEMNEPDSFEVLGEAGFDTSSTSVERLGSAELEGELVDVKCWLGVMRPATGKVHRACAARCLAGGIPPGLLIRDEDETTLVVLAGTGDDPLDFDPQWAGLRVRARGVLELHEDHPVLRTERLHLADARDGSF